jgi:hypothetical protein
MPRTISLISILAAVAFPLFSSPPPATYDGLLLEAQFHYDGTMDIDLSMFGVPMMVGSYALGQKAEADYLPLFYASATTVSVDPVSNQVLLDLELKIPFMGFNQTASYSAPLCSLMAAWSPGNTVDWPELGPVDARAGFLAIPDRVRIGGDLMESGCETIGWVEAMTPAHPYARVFNPCYGLFEAEVLNWDPFPRLRIRARGGEYEFDLKALVPYGFYYFRINVD